MPVFQDPERRQERPWEQARPAIFPMPGRRTSEESIRTEFCEGPLLDEQATGPAEETSPKLAGSSLQETFPLETIDRAEFIQRIKRGENPTWVPNRKLEPLFTEVEPSPFRGSTAPKSQARGLLPAFELEQRGTAPNATIPSDSLNGNLHAGFEIERPRSALHAGDFTEASVESRARQDKPSLPSSDSAGTCAINAIATSPHPPWLSPLSRKTIPLPTTQTPHSQATTIDFNFEQGIARSRASSLRSISSSFVLKAPTSPLVQEANNNDLEHTSIDFSSIPALGENRRHTMPPHNLQSLKSFPSGLAQAARQPGSLHRDGSYPLRNHQARRSLTFGGTFLPPSSPPTPNFLRSRRPSYSSDASPLQHASMVGSYEESILRGRMSTTPSKPVDFTAKIGALGFGDCKPKYPAHVTLDFPAAYYSWNDGREGFGSIADEPSPYVGQIDLEHKLPPPERKEKRARRAEALQMDEQDALSESSCNNAVTRKREKRKRRSTSPSKLPPGGSYRIPEKGHLQILIKNPNKTAVKLFLVPYDLHGMEAGTKTFVRQKCYSTGPVVENPLSSKSPSESAPDSKAVPNDPKNKPKIRYMVHLHICCPSKGRFYLYKTISVVFANRVPDNKEQLQNEIRLPEPRYSPYKPSSEQQPGSLSFESKRALEKLHRRRSIGYSTSARTGSFEGSQGTRFSPGMSLPSRPDVDIPPVPSIPFDFITPEKAHASTGIPREPDIMEIDGVCSAPNAAMQSPLSDKVSRIAAAKFSGSVRSNSSSNSNDSYNKLSKGEIGYGGVFGRPGTPEPGEGLLARRLRGLDVEMNGNDQNA